MSRPRAASEQQLLAGEGDEYEESELHIKEAGVLPDEDSDLECKPADDGGGSGAEPGAYLYQVQIKDDSLFNCSAACPVALAVRYLSTLPPSTSSLIF